MFAETSFTPQVVSVKAWQAELEMAAEAVEVVTEGAQPIEQEDSSPSALAMLEVPEDRVTMSATEWGDALPPTASAAPTLHQSAQGESVEERPAANVSIRDDTEDSNSAACPCCLEDFRETDRVAILRCGHIYCLACIKDWVCRTGSKVSRCPLCRQIFAEGKSESS
eukprot:TRINITY_DN15305_c0_g1_i1.p1 TRINITY_DN15305_c0_g1~~TRINITY_DN15305_c0_g1_i1.p1  ORF type:complete len:167 (-),score=30.59 TRINITY_DN15305_c0_g1_i1:205-705(-)